MHTVHRLTCMACAWPAPAQVSGAPPGVVLVITKALELLKALIAMLLKSLKQLVTPGDVSFD